jgi:hypothetical protein
LNPNIGLAKEEWTSGRGTPVVKGLIWFTDGSRMKEGSGAGMSIWEEGSVFLLEGTLQFFRLRYMLSWLVHMKFKRMVDLRNT